MRRSRDSAQKVQVLFLGVGLKVGKVHTLRLGGDVGTHDLAVVFGVDAKPVLPVMACNYPVTLPALGVGAGTGVQKTQGHSEPRCTVECKVKPLRKSGGVVLANVELDVPVVGQAHDLDGPGVKLAGDVQCGHVVK